jgi:LmbE family N-acetylglucosaminyl deacetylase
MGMPDARPASLSRPAKSSGRIRRAELLRACDVLGIERVEHGGHPDGALAAADPDLVIGRSSRFCAASVRASC